MHLFFVCIYFSIYSTDKTPLFCFSFTQHFTNQHCPSCKHRFLQEIHGKKELKAINKARKKKVFEKLAEFEDETEALLDPATRPRMHEKVEEYKCACFIIGGSECPECEGMDDKCEICACDCEMGPEKLSNFEAISRAAQAKEADIEENAAMQTVHQKRGSFADMIQNAMVVRSTESMHVSSSHPIPSNVFM